MKNKFLATILIVLLLGLPLKPLLANGGKMIITQDTVLTQDFQGSIEIAADNLTLDCQGHKISGSGGGYGIDLESKDNITIKNCLIENFAVGVNLWCASDNQIFENTIADNDLGIKVACAELASDNLVYHNNFKNNDQQASLIAGDNDLFDNGYPEGGNYWSDYQGQDLKKGENQDQWGQDGIGDTVYIFSGVEEWEKGEDHYPYVKENGWQEEAAPAWRKDIQSGDLLYDAGALAGIGHIGIYVGSVEVEGVKLFNQVIEGVAEGVKYHNIEEWDEPKKHLVYLLRVDAADEIKEKAITFAKIQRDKPYEFPWLVKNPDPNSLSWYCSELVWAAYYNQGVNIEAGAEPFNNPVAPEEIYNDKDALVVGSHLNYTAYYLEFAKSLLFRIYSPVEVEITDPQGNIISKEKNEIPETAYIIEDLDGDGEVEDTVAIAKRLSGDYLIKITPKPGASPDETYTLKVIAGGAEIILADNLRIGDIPAGGQFFTLNSTDSTINGISVNQNSADPPIHGSFYDIENSEGNSFSAGTLDFSITNTEIEELIGVGLGEDVEFASVVTKTAGSLGIQYKARAEKISGNGDFCNALEMEVSHSAISYDGDLLSFNTAVTTALGTWAFEIKLPQTATNFAHGEECNVDLVFEGWRDDAADFNQSGFTDEERIHLRLTSRMIVLNEFLPNPNGEEYGFNFGEDSDVMPQGEWVELYNNSDFDFDLAGYYLTDADGNRIDVEGCRTNTGGTVVPAGGFLVVYRNGGGSCNSHNFSLNNDGDTVKLFDGDDRLVDSHAYTSNDYCDIEPTPGDENSTDTSGACAGVPPNKSYARIPDGIGDWVDPIPTPGRMNVLESENIYTAPSAAQEEPLAIEIAPTESVGIEEVLDESTTEEIITDKQAAATEEIIDEAATEEEIVTTTEEIVKEEPLAEEPIIEEETIAEDEIIEGEPAIIEEQQPAVEQQPAAEPEPEPENENPEVE